MSEQLKIKSSLRKKIKLWIEKNKVIDVIVFGSTVRGKTKPGDLDFCLILHDEQEKKTLELVDSFTRAMEKEGNIQCNIITASAFILGKESLAKTLLQEGTSMFSGKAVSSSWGLQTYALFLYSLVSFSASKRVRFHYLLRGRNQQKGILAKLDGDLLKDGIIKVPISQEDQLREIFDLWGVNYRIERVFWS